MGMMWGYLGGCAVRPKNRISAEVLWNKQNLISMMECLRNRRLQWSCNTEKI